MPDWLKHLKEFLSLDYRSLFILAISSWIIALAPAWIWQTFGLINLWTEFRPWIFVLALLSSIWLIAGGIFDVAKNQIIGVKQWIQSLNARKSYAQILQATSRVEREILCSYVTHDTTTLAFEIRNGIVNGLIAKGILYRSSKLTNPSSYDLDTNIQPWAWEYIKAHPQFFLGIQPSPKGRHQL